MPEKQPQTAIEGYRVEMARRKQAGEWRTQYGSAGAALLAALDVATDPETGNADAGMAAMRAVARVGQELKESVDLDVADPLIVSLDDAAEKVLAEPSKRNRLDKVRAVLGVMVAAARQAHADRNPPPAAPPEPVRVPYLKGRVVGRAPGAKGQDAIEIEVFAWNAVAAEVHGFPVADGVDAQRITVERPAGTLPPPPPRARLVDAKGNEFPDEGELVVIDGDEMSHYQRRVRSEEEGGGLADVEV